MPVPVVTALPSAIAPVSTKLSDSRRSCPPAVTFPPSGMAAREVASTTETETAPATATGPPSVVDEPCEVLPVVPAPAPPEVARSLAKPCWLPTWPSTPPPAAPPLSSSAWPATLACASALLIDSRCDMKLMSPPELSVRAVVATAVSLTTLSAIEMPTPVSPDFVSPAASVTFDPSCDALADSAPLTVVAAPAFSVAWVSLLATVNANTGVIAVLPAAPPAACVSIALLDDADIVRSCAPVSRVLVPRIASVSVSPMFSASEMPMPNLPKPSWLAVALALFSTKFSAVRVTSPLSVMVTFAPPASVAVDSVRPMFSASDPATPVATPLTPETAVAPIRLVVSVQPSVCSLPVPADDKATRPVSPPASAPAFEV